MTEKERVKLQVERAEMRKRLKLERQKKELLKRLRGRPTLVKGYGKIIPLEKYTAEGVNCLE